MRLSSFLCVTVDEAGRENGIVSIWDLITGLKWSYTGERQASVALVHAGRVPLRKEIPVCQLRSLQTFVWPYTMILLYHVLCDIQCDLVYI